MSEIISCREAACFNVTEAHPRQGEGSFLRLKDGRLLLVYSRFNAVGGDASPCDLVASWSSDDGETWTEPVTAVAASGFGVKNVMSASLMQMQNGDVGLFYIVKAKPTDSQIWMSLSRDGGETWYERRMCTLPDRKGYYVLNNDRVIRLKSGRLVMPLAFHRGGFNGTREYYWDSRGVVFCLLSDDDGITWREGRDGAYAPFTGTVTGLQEPGVVELENGVLWAYYRTDHMFHYEAFSFDGGETWTQPQPSRFTAPDSPMQIKWLHGALTAIWNPIPNYNGRKAGRMAGRTPMVAARCIDGKWSEPFILDSEDDHDYCYPAMIEVPGGFLAAYMGSHRTGIRLIVKKITLA